MNKKEQVLEKLKKLKALAEGALKVGSIEESHNAAMKIKNLTDKYNISLLDLDGLSEDEKIDIDIDINISEPINTRNTYGIVWREQVLKVLADFFFCKVLKKGNSAYVVGSAVNRMTLLAIYDSATSIYLNAAKEVYKKEQVYMRGGQRTEKYRKNYIQSYLIGASMGLSARLKIEADRANTTKVALYNSSAIDSFIKEKLSVRPTQQRKRKASICDSAYASGYTKGKTTDLRKTIKQ